jgi:hypothetical protein
MSRPARQRQKHSRLHRKVQQRSCGYSEPQNIRGELVPPPPLRGEFAPRGERRSLSDAAARRVLNAERLGGACACSRTPKKHAAGGSARRRGTYVMPSRRLGAACASSAPHGTSAVLQLIGPAVLTAGRPALAPTPGALLGTPHAKAVAKRCGCG